MNPPVRPSASVSTLLSAWLAAVALVSGALAQPPEGPPPEPGRPPQDPLRVALDANHDRELDAEEIRNAPSALAKLDRNGDGRIDREELRPPPPPQGMRGAGPGAGPGGPGRREGGSSPETLAERALASDGDGDGKLSREELTRFATSNGAGRREGGPAPERLVDRAFEFDVDGDGRLDRGELETFARGMLQRRPGGPAGGRGAAGVPPGAGDRPERATRPE